MKSALVEQEESTRFGLEFTQITANVNALDAMINEKAEKLREVNALYIEGIARTRRTRVGAELATILANKVFQETKERARDLARESMALRDEAEPDIRQAFEQMQNVS
jgi:hypothetical protein